MAVGLTAWEVTTNLSLAVYLLRTNVCELRHRDRGRCFLWWVAVDGRNNWLPQTCSVEKCQDAIQEDALQEPMCNQEMIREA